MTVIPRPVQWVTRFVNSFVLPIQDTKGRGYGAACAGTVQTERNMSVISHVMKHAVLLPTF
jgi:hypothetical protein